MASLPEMIGTLVNLKLAKLAHIKQLLCIKIGCSQAGHCYPPRHDFAVIATWNHFALKIWPCHPYCKICRARGMRCEMADLWIPPDKIVGSGAQLMEHFTLGAEKVGFCRHVAAHSHKVFSGRGPLDIMHWPFLQRWVPMFQSSLLLLRYEFGFQMWSTKVGTGRNSVAWYVQDCPFLPWGTQLLTKTQFWGL